MVSFVGWTLYGTTWNVGWRLCKVPIADSTSENWPETLNTGEYIQTLPWTGLLDVVSVEDKTSCYSFNNHRFTTDSGIAIMESNDICLHIVHQNRNIVLPQHGVQRTSGYVQGTNWMWLCILRRRPENINWATRFRRLN